MVMKNLTKCLLLGFAMLGFIGCFDDSTKMSKQMDSQWEDYAKGFESTDTSDKKEIFNTKLQTLNTKIAFYACAPFDSAEKIVSFNLDKVKKCAKNALAPLDSIDKLCKSDNAKDKDYQKCAIDGRENLFATTRKLARYKYDSEFDKSKLKEADLAIFASAIEGEVSREMGLFDSKIGKADKEQAKSVAKTLTIKASQGALKDYALDSKNQPFNAWLGTHSRKLQKATKKSAENCIQSKCGEFPPDLLGLMFSAALPYAFVGAFGNSKEQREMQKQMESAVLGVLLNHPWGKCMIDNETKCQIESIKEYGVN